MKKFICLVITVGFIQAVAADPVTPYSKAWGERVQAALQQASGEAEACVFATEPAKSLPADFNGTTKVALSFKPDGSLADAVIAQTSGNAALDAAELECYRAAPHLAAVGEAMQPQHAVTVVSDWQALRKRH